jgi:outer membrane receptor protein involved in Fe transport
MNVTGVLKYEYDKYFEIDAGIKYRSSDRIPYYKTGEEGKFDIGTADATLFTIFGDFLFHRGPYGRFYGNIELNSAKDNDDNRVPYHPVLTGELSYGYDLGIIDLYSTLYYSTSAYTDIPNEEEVPQYFNLGAGMNLKIEENFSLFFELNNLLNRNIYFWKGYKEPPLDLVGGLIFRW